MTSLKVISSVFFVYVLLVVPTTSAIEYPRIEPYVNDFADVLSPDQELQLNLLADSIEANTTVEIALVTVKNTQGMNRIEYANRIGDVNGVGKKDTDNGVVVLFSLDNEKGGAIAVGRGIESVLNDAKASRIGRDHRQLFDEGKYAEGFTAIVNDLRSEIVAGKNVPQPVAQTKGDDFSEWFIIIFVIGMVVLFFIVLFRFIVSPSAGDLGYGGGKKRRKGRDDEDYYTGAAVATAAATSASSDDEDDESRSSRSSSSSSNSSSWSRGFGSFGGGSFGGGGGGF